MIGDFTVRQVILVIIVILIIFFILAWAFTPRRKTVIYQTFASSDSDPENESVACRPVAENQLTEGRDTAFVLYYFFSPYCGHCKQFSPTWNNVSNKLKSVEDLSLKEIDGSNKENENLAFYYNISGYPTIILVTPEKNIEYMGNRTQDDLHNFVLNNINDHMNRWQS